MSVEIQTYLMEEIQRVGTFMENFVEIKDIMSTIERLEEENELLRDKLKISHENNHQLT
mgnify:CR=1 FL=1